MDFKKVVGKNMALAESLVKDLEKSIGRNQKALTKNVEEHKALIEKGKDLVTKLATAQEYLDDLVEAETK